MRRTADGASGLVERMHREVEVVAADAVDRAGRRSPSGAGAAPVAVRRARSRSTNGSPSRSVRPPGALLAVRGHLLGRRQQGGDSVQRAARPGRRPARSPATQSRPTVRGASSSTSPSTSRMRSGLRPSPIAAMRSRRVRGRGGVAPPRRRSRAPERRCRPRAAPRGRRTARPSASAHATDARAPRRRLLHSSGRRRIIHRFLEALDAPAHLLLVCGSTRSHPDQVPPRPPPELR